MLRKKELLINLVVNRRIIIKIRNQIIRNKKDEENIFLFLGEFDIIVMIGEIGGNMNNKGQALIEFVLILPVFIFILFAVVDFGIIFNSKSNLENDCSSIVELFKNGTSIEEIKRIYDDNIVNISNDGSYYKLSVSTSIDLITPGLNRVLGDPYLISVERIIPYA